MNDSLRISVSRSEDENPIEGLVGQLGLSALVAKGVRQIKSAEASVEIRRNALVRRNMG